MSATTHLSTQHHGATLTGRAGGWLAGLWAGLRSAVRQLNRLRLYRVDQLPPEVLRDVDPALHDAMQARFNGWYGLDARNRPPFY